MFHLIPINPVQALVVICLLCTSFVFGFLQHIDRNFGKIPLLSMSNLGAVICGYT